MRKLKITNIALMLFTCLLLGSGVHADSINRSVAPEKCPASLHAGFIDYDLAPLIYSRDPADTNANAPHGLAVDWLRQALAETQCPSRLSVDYLPAKRGRVELQANRIDLWVLAVPDQDVLQFGAVPMKNGQPDRNMSFHLEDYFLYTTRGNQTFSWDGVQLSGLTNGKVLVGPSVALQQFARAKGWPIEILTDSHRALKMLLIGHSEIALLPDELVAHASQTEQEGITRLGPVVFTAGYQTIISKAFYASFPEFSEILWRNLCHAGRPNDRSACK